MCNFVKDIGIWNYTESILPHPSYMGKQKHRYNCTPYPYKNGDNIRIKLEKGCSKSTLISHLTGSGLEYGENFDIRKSDIEKYFINRIMVKNMLFVNLLNYQWNLQQFL